MTKMSSMPYKVKTIKKSSSLELIGQPSLVLVCNIRDMEIFSNDDLHVTG